MNQFIYSNPFIECTARDMSYEEVLKYWCSPFKYFKLDERSLFNSLTPIFIQGARGSGKTMILKYLSYFCQKELAQKAGEKDILQYFRQAGSIGFYFRYKEDFGRLFETITCSTSTKKDLFLYYYELYITREILYVLNDMYKSYYLNETVSNSLTTKISEILALSSPSFEDLLEELNRKISKIDDWVKKCRYFSNAEEMLKKLMTNNDLIKKICNSIRTTVTDLDNIKFMIIIDEYENAFDYQLLINTLIKQVDSTDSITYRIGLRPGGLYTYNTNIGREFLQLDRDYIQKNLRFDTIHSYKKFIQEVANRRLETVKEFRENDFIDIKVILGDRENLESEAKEIVRNDPEKHFDKLKIKYKDCNDFNYAKETLKYPNNPLIEMLNIIWVLRGIPIEQTVSSMNLYLKGEYSKNSPEAMKKLAYKYKRDYVDKYKYQLITILANIYKTNKKYYSFNTFAFLSSQTINDFISLCRNTFYCLDETFYNDLFINKNDFVKNKVIPIRAQCKGATQTAIEQVEKVKLCNENGTEMYTFLINVGNLFQEMHQDISAKYPETNQFAFENEAQIESRPLLKNILNNLIKWGVIFKKERPQSISIGRKKGNLFHLNRIFCPYFNISYRTRGGYNFVIETLLFENMLNNSMEASDVKNWQEILPKKKEWMQQQLFEGDLEGE